MNETINTTNVAGSSSFAKTGNRIAIIGECMIELNGRPFMPQQQAFGGDTLNTAVYFSRLLPEVLTHYVTVMGEDNYSATMLSEWEKEDISTTLVLRDPTRLPGLYAIEIDADGERSFHYWRSNSAARYLCQHAQFDEIENALKKMDWVYLSGISLAILPEEGKQRLFETLQGLRQQGVNIVVDSNYRPRLWDSAGHAQLWLNRLYSVADIALVTLDDEALLHQKPSMTVEAVHDKLTQCGVGTQVIKIGKEGAQWFKQGAEVEYLSGSVPTKLISNVVDTTAAGDSFNAGFLAARLSGHDIQSCCEWGNAVAGEVIQHKGAIIPRLEIEKVKLMLENI